VGSTEQSSAPDGPIAARAAEPAAERLVEAVNRLGRQVAHWQPARWSTAGGAGPGEAATGGPGVAVAGSRGDRVHALVQRLADRGALAERRLAGGVPRLNDLVLPDQLRVVADDLIAAGAPGDDLIAAADDVDAVRRTL